VVRAGLRLLEDSQQQAEMQRDLLRAAIASGLESGVPIAAEPLFDRLEAQYQAQLNKKAST
jgi:Arc/MetJ-type ribon-helix-helix transcriptional regulator